MFKFMVERLYRKNMKANFKRTISLVIFIQTKFRNSMELQEARLSALQQLWERDSKELFFQAARHGKASPLMAFSTKLRTMDKEIRDGCLKMYLNACKYKHAIAFFQWRHKYSPQNRSDMLASIFSARMRKLQEMNDQREHYQELLDQVEATSGTDSPELRGSVMRSHLSEYEHKPNSSEVSHSSEGLARMKSLKMVLSSNVALKDIHDLERDIDDQLYDKTSVIHYFEEINWQDPFPENRDEESAITGQKKSRRAKHAERKRRTSLINKISIN
jgi:hypothetical protein